MKVNFIIFTIFILKSTLLLSNPLCKDLFYQQNNSALSESRSIEQIMGKDLSPLEVGWRSQLGQPIENNGASRLNGRHQSLYLTPNHRYVVSLSTKGKVRIFDAQTKDVLAKVPDKSKGYKRIAAVSNNYLVLYKKVSKRVNDVKINERTSGQLVVYNMKGQRVFKKNLYFEKLTGVFIINNESQLMFTDSLEINIFDIKSKKKWGFDQTNTTLNRAVLNTPRLKTGNNTYTIHRSMILNDGRSLLLFFESHRKNNKIIILSIDINDLESSSFINYRILGEQFIYSITSYDSQAAIKLMTGHSDKNSKTTSEDMVFHLIKMDDFKVQ